MGARMSTCGGGERVSEAGEGDEDGDEVDKAKDEGASKVGVL